MSMYYNQFREVERATTLTFLLPKTLQQLWLKPLDKYYVITQRVFGEEIALRRQSGTDLQNRSPHHRLGSVAPKS